MSDIVAFLEARLAEDEATAGDKHRYDCDLGALQLYGECSCGYPARVLAEIAAKRARIAEFRTWDAKLKQVGERPDTFSDGNRGEIQGMWMMARRAIQWDATVYADHPDYDPAWAV